MNYFSKKYWSFDFTNGQSLSLLTISLTSDRDVKITFTRSWKRSFWGQLIITHDPCSTGLETGCKPVLFFCAPGAIWTRYGPRELKQIVIFSPNSSVTQFVFVFLPGRQPLNYYVCSNVLTNHELEDPEFKLNWQLTVLQIASLCIHLIANLR